MKRKVTLVNNSEAWDANRRYKINAVVSYAGSDWQNATGINSEPGVGTDWVRPDIVVPNFQEVTNEGAATTNPITVQTIVIKSTGFANTQIGNFCGDAATEQTAVGFEAGSPNTGAGQTAVGRGAGNSNSGEQQVAIGKNAGSGNSGTDNISIGTDSGTGNTADNTIIIGPSAGTDNTFSDVTLLGRSASADGNSQVVFSKNLTTFQRFSFLLLTATRKVIWPDKDGTVAFISDLPKTVDNFANDTLAAAGGIGIGKLYHTSGVVKIRLT